MAYGVLDFKGISVDNSTPAPIEANLTTDERLEAIERRLDAAGL